MLSHTKFRLAPTVEKTGQEPGRRLITQFRILIVYVVKMYKRRLQTASASPRDPTAELPSPDALCYSQQ